MCDCKTCPSAHPWSRRGHLLVDELKVDKPDDGAQGTGRSDARLKVDQRIKQLGLRGILVAHHGRGLLGEGLISDLIGKYKYVGDYSIT